MGDFSRYAVYFAPRPTRALARFGADWLGWDAETGLERPPMRHKELPATQAEIVAAPRRYGFHGTLKAPFRLAEDVAPAELDAAVGELARGFAPFAVPLGLEALGPFLALTPLRASVELQEVADACVTRLDRFRAPLSAQEIARRQATNLTPRQQAHLAAWGYPFVLEDFTFHLTLTGPLAPETQARVATLLREQLGPIIEEPMAFEDLCLFGEASDGRFHLVTRHPFGAAAAPP